MSSDMIAAGVLDGLKGAVGPGGWIEDEERKSAYLVDERRLFHGSTPLVLRPSTVEEVARIVRICAAAAVGIVPSGGNTGYVGGSIPSSHGNEVLLSLERLNRIRRVDPIDYTMTVEAGCVLATVQHAAAGVDRLFPLSLAAEGSCTIGGNLATNAGGTAVLRYGNARDLVLGLEVVLPDGQIWDGLRRLRKDNSGYDLKQIFLGAEGTLGIITAAVLKLFPQPAQRSTCLAAVADADAALSLLSALRGTSADAVTSFEYMQRVCMELVIEHIATTSDPFDQAYEHYTLIELAGGDPDGPLPDLMESTLASAFERGEVLDAVIATSMAQAEELWKIRETIAEAQKLAGGCIKHDVSVPVSRLPDFLRQATTLAADHIPGVRVAPFGHMGDGNIHFNLTQPLTARPEIFLAEASDISKKIHDLAVAFGGSFSAEHGIGMLKKTELKRYKSPLELALMHKIKATFDPQGIMNPGKIL